MPILATFALVGWPFIVLAIFALLPSRQAAAIAVIGAWLFLPPVSLGISGLPDYSKNSAAMVGVVLGTLIFSPDRILNFRPRWFDLPMFLWCLSGIVTSVQNGLGLYDGLSEALNQTVTWGMPYLVGRWYFGDPAGLRTITTGVAIGALWYVPFCQFETRMMMSLLLRIYGIGRWGSGAGLRGGAYRPSVFFATGLELGLYMTAGSLAGWWLWRCGVLKKVGQFRFGPVLLPVLIVATILCRATGALFLLAIGMLILWLSARFRTRLVVAGLLLFGPFYAGIRIPNLWTGQQAVELVRFALGNDRADSLGHRFKCENLLIARALQQPLFGWGAFGRSDAHLGRETGYKRVDTDGMWVIYLGTKGMVGLTLLYLAVTLPAIMFVWRFPARLWADPRLASGTLCAVLLGLYVIDCLMNGFINVIYLTLAGGLAGLEPRQLGRRDRSHGVAAGARTGLGALGAVAIEPGSHGGRMVLADRYRSLGRLFKQEGRRDEADSAWQRALDVLTSLLAAEPDSAELRRRWCDCANDLVWLRVNHPDPARRDLKTAVTMARRMVEECPEAAAYWNTLGVACYRAGDDAAAVAALESATELGGGSVFDDVFLAMAHARRGDLDCARRELARAEVRAERDYPGHSELAVFRDEARSIVAQGTETPAASQ